MNDADIDEIFKLAKLVKAEKDELKAELEKVRASVKKKRETLGELYQLLR